MYSKAPSGKGSKGSVAVEAYQGRLRLRLPRELDLKNRYLSLGMDDTLENRQLAEAKASLIKSDITYERFDFTLNKYRNKLKVVAQSTQTEKTSTVNLIDIWDKFCEVKKAG